MTLSKAIDFQNVGELSLRLRAARASRERFSLEIPARDCANGLYAAFRNEVEGRGGAMMLDGETKAHIMSAAEWLTDPKGTPGLLMCGLCGNGKTTLALAIKRLVEWATRQELGYSRRKEVRMVTAKEACRLARTDAGGYRELLGAELLAIDDLGDEPKEVITYGSVETPVTDLLSERYAGGLFTIATTNLDTDELGAKYGERIRDRLAEMMTPIVFENESYRQRRKQTQQS